MSYCPDRQSELHFLKSSGKSRELLMPHPKEFAYCLKDLFSCLKSLVMMLESIHYTPRNRIILIQFYRAIVGKLKKNKQHLR
jgi:hypothetical protein